MRKNRPIILATFISMLLHALLFLVIKGGVTMLQPMEVFVPVTLLEEAEELVLPVSGENSPADIEDPAFLEPAIAERTPGQNVDSEQVQSVQPRPVPSQVEASGASKTPGRHSGDAQADAKGQGQGNRTTSGIPGSGTTQGHREGPGEGDTGAPIAIGPGRWPSIPKGLENRGVIKAKVVFNVLVAEDGTPAQIELQEGSGYSELDSRALREISRRWRFKPRLKSGHPVADWITITVKFGESD
ncbi:MAG: TonB family protein [bacterium]|nr:TonB family protein [bacterium]MDD4557318.1 TonB family protein [bacterium]